MNNIKQEFLQITEALAPASTTKIVSSVPNAISLAECIKAAKLVSMDSQSLCDARDSEFLVIQACLKSAENSLKLYHDMLQVEDSTDAKAELCLEIWHLIRKKEKLMKKLKNTSINIHVSAAIVNS